MNCLPNINSVLINYSPQREVTGQPKLVLYPSLQNLVKSAVGHPTKKIYITQILKTFS